MNDQLSKKEWDQIKQLLNQAIELDEEKAKSFALSAKQLNQAQRNWLIKMVDVHFDPDKLTITPDEISINEALEPTLLAPGAVLDKYIIQKQIGKGGMGEVYLANRADEVNQLVAIKIFKTHLSASGKRRFEMERKIVAKMEHPNIARFIDSGSHENVPYYVMEYVDGVPIDDYANTHHLTIKERLELLMQVCDAIGFAHSKLTIHRDLKPSNILVDKNGLVKLMDFGIAKIIEDEVDTDSLLKTRAGNYVYTPQYAAPEQFTGDGLGVSTDVFVIGVLMFHLLTDQNAFDLAGKTWGEIEHIIKHEVQPNPSSVINKMHVDPHKFGSTNIQTIKNQLQGDLDEIVRHAMQKDAELRYQSIEMLKQDIQCYLDNQPISVKRNIKKYRIKKFIKRNAAVLTLASTLLLSGIFFVAFTIQQNQEIKSQSILLKEQRDLAIREKNKATVLSDLLLDSFKQADPSQKLKNNLRAVNVLDEAARLVADQSFEHDDIRAEVSLPISAIYNNMAEFNKSIAILEAVDFDQIKDADLLARLIGEKATAMASLGGENDAMAFIDSFNPEVVNHPNVKIVKSLITAGKGESNLAEQYLSEVFTSIDKDNEDYFFICSQLGKRMASNRKLDEAEELLISCKPKEPDSVNAQTQWGNSLLDVQIGFVAYLRRDFTKAEKIWTDVLNFRLSTFGENHIITINSYELLTAVLNETFREQEALEYQMKLINGLKTHFGRNHIQVARHVFNLGVLYSNLEQDNEATLHYLDAINMAQNHDNNHANLAYYHHTLALSYLNLKQMENAEDNFKESIRRYSNQNNGSPVSVAAVQSYLAEAYIGQGRIQEAKELVTQVYPIIEENYLENHPTRIHANEIFNRCKTDCLPIN